MSMAPVRSRFSRKTLAIALAVGVSFGGVHIVGPEMGLNTAAVASAAELDVSVVTNTELVSVKSGQNVLGTTVEATQNAYDAFLNTHGTNFKLKLDVEIPDSAQPGDKFVITKTSGYFDLDGNIEAYTEDGHKIGDLTVTRDNATFTVSDQVGDAINRTASFEVPYSLDSSVTLTGHQVTTDQKENDGKPAPNSTYSFSSDPTSTLTLKRVYVYEANQYPVIMKTTDNPYSVGQFSSPNIDAGSSNANISFDVGYANAFPSGSGDDTYIQNPSATTARDVTIRYTIDDEDGRIFLTGQEAELHVHKFSPKKLKSPKSDEPPVQNKRPFLYTDVTDKTFDVTAKQINEKTVDVTVHDLPPEYAVRLGFGYLKAESAYSPGKTVTLTGTFIDGVGDPHNAYRNGYTQTKSVTYTHPSFAGYGSADDVKPAATMSAKVNGQEADDVTTAQLVENNKAMFSIDLKNNGNIGARSATVKYPEGVTGPNGETEKFIDFGNDGFPVGSTKTLDLGELNVPEGINENKFSVVMTGYPELTDAAWTTTELADIYVDSVKREDDTVIITRNDGEEFTFTVNNTNGIKDVIVNNDGSITIVRDNRDEEKIELAQTTVTEANAGTPDHTITITTPDGKSVTFNAFDVYITDIKKNANGDYDIYRSDIDEGKTVWKTIKLDDLRKDIADLRTDLEDKDAEQDERLDNLEQQVNDTDEKLKELTIQINNNAGDIENHHTMINDILITVDTIQNDIKDIQGELERLDGQDIKEIRDNGDGTYTLIRKDNSEVTGEIDTSGNITNIISDGNGNLIVTTADGNTTTVAIDQITITEANEGTPEHTVTITTPDGQEITFDVFDVYVTDVVKQEDGNYKIIRNDGTEWIIDLKDIRDKIAALENKDSPNSDELDQVKQELADLKIKIDKEFTHIDSRFTNVEGDIADLHADLTALEIRVISIEARLSALEGRTDNITTCVAGAGLVGIPALLSIPLTIMAQINIPGINDLNTQIQKQVGIYNADAARALERNGGLLQAGAALAGLAAILGGIAYIANQCGPMMQSDAAKDTDLGKLSSKLGKSTAKTATNIEDDSSAQKDAVTEQNTEAEVEAEQPAGETGAEVHPITAE